MIYKRLLQIVFAIFLLYMLSTCSSHQSSQSSNSSSLPSQFLNPSEVYDSALYLTSTGSGDNQEQAQQSALASLSQQIEVQVQSNFETNNQYQEDDNSLKIRTDIFDLSRSRSEETLIGVEYGASFVDALGRTHIIATINRVKVAGIYLGRMEENNTNKNSEIMRAENAQNFQRFSHYLQALNYAEANDRLLAQLEVISFSQSAFGKNIQKKGPSSSSIKSLIQETAQQLRFSLQTEIQSDQKLESKQDLEQRLRFSITQLLNALQFQVTEQDNNYQARVIVIWNEELGETYPSIYWNLNFQIIELSTSASDQSASAGGRSILSKNIKGRSKGIDKDSAVRLAIYDIDLSIVEIVSSYIQEFFQSK